MLLERQGSSCWVGRHLGQFYIVGLSWLISYPGGQKGFQFRNVWVWERLCNAYILTQMSPGMSVPCHYVLNGNFSVNSIESHTRLDKYRPGMTSGQFMSGFAINTFSAKFRGKMLRFQRILDFRFSFYFIHCTR